MDHAIVGWLPRRTLCSPTMIMSSPLLAASPLSLQCLSAISRKSTCVMFLKFIQDNPHFRGSSVTGFRASQCLPFRFIHWPKFIQDNHQDNRQDFYVLQSSPCQHCTLCPQASKLPTTSSSTPSSTPSSRPRRAALCSSSRDSGL